MKEKVTINDQIANTLFIPLYMRFKESRRPNGIMNDHLACELINRIDYDFSQFDKAPLSELGCVVRGCYFDRKVQEFSIPVSNESQNGAMPHSTNSICRK